ncbi:MAG: ATP-binding protein [Ginsengibacter sp.]|jgi:signal transduction histidine kinase
MVKIFFDKIANRTRLGFLIAFFLLILSYFLTFISTQKVINQANRVNQTNKIIHDLDKVLISVIHGEASSRGYFITRDSSLLREYKINTALADSTIEDLKLKVADNGEQVTNLNQLNNLLRENVLWMNEFQENYSSSSLDNPSLINEWKNRVKALENVESQIVKMQLIESNIWQTRGKEVSEYTRLIKMFNTISIILAILFTLFSLIVYNKENKAKKEETNKAREFRKQLETRIQELADLNKELIDLRSLEKYAATGRIARTIAHEVRNPLTNINLSIEQLKTEVPETETTELFFKMIVRNSERINNLVSDLLNSTRVTELKFADVNVNDIVNESLAMALDRIELKQIKVVKDFEMDMCTIPVDVQKIQLAFLNIIVNAIEAMESQGILTIKTANEKEKCVVRISDNGIGMNKAEMDKLFEPYFTTKEKGNGLGLANSQNIILGHNGTISAISEPGVGTTFTVILKF